MEKADFVSKLGSGELRLLAEVLEHSLVSGRRTADDFIHHFPPSAIMDSLDGQPKLRATFLTLLVGLREKTALRTPSGDAGRLLQAALEEGDTDSEAIVGTFDPDDRIRYLPPQKVWSFITEGEFWKASRSKDPAAHKLAQSALANFTDRALAHGLASHADIIDGVSVELLADKLPRAELTKILRRALDLGKNGTPFKPSDFYDASPASVLVDHIGLPQIFENVVLPVARNAGYAEPPKAAEPVKADSPKVTESAKESKAEKESKSEKAESSKVESTKPAAPPLPATSAAAPSVLPWADDSIPPEPLDPQEKLEN
jgi:hypothetical protein